MASSSSAKKVARIAARSGSGSGANAGNAAKQRNWLFAVAIVAIVGVGVGAVAFARHQNEGLGKNDTRPLARVTEGEPYDHWHASFALEACGEELGVIQQKEPDTQGIHTHGDGLIHIHPFTVRAAGKSATLKKFFDQTGLNVTDRGFTTQDGQSYRAGDGSDDTTTCAGEETEVVLAHWKKAATASGTPPDQIYRKDFASVRFTEDLGAYTLALIPKGDDGAIKPPAASAQIAELGAVDGGTSESNAPEPSDEGEVTTTVPPADEATTTKPAADDATTTTAAPEAEG